MCSANSSGTATGSRDAMRSRIAAIAAMPDFVARPITLFNVATNRCVNRAGHEPDAHTRRADRPAAQQWRWEPLDGCIPAMRATPPS